MQVSQIPLFGFTHKLKKKVQPTCWARDLPDGEIVLYSLEFPGFARVNTRCLTDVQELVGPGFVLVDKGILVATKHILKPDLVHHMIGVRVGVDDVGDPVVVWIAVTRDGKKRLQLELPSFKRPTNATTTVADAEQRIRERHARTSTKSFTPLATSSYTGSMSPHVITVDGTRSVIGGVVDVGRNGDRPLVRFHPSDDGDLVVLAPSGALIDGRPMVGGVAVVSWGSGAVVRADDLRVEVRFEAARETMRATAGMRCALCFDAVRVGEIVARCVCRSTVHAECYALLISCPSCGAAP
jgi:hypothetical protein